MVTATRTQQLIELIRFDIVRDILPSGRRITEEALAERYSVSRTPVREALRVLARESLLRYVPRTGYVVASVDLAEMDDLYAVRVAIEEQVAAHIVVRDAAATLQELLDFWRAAPKAPDVGDVNLVFADEAFHETLADASGSTVFPALLRNINVRLHALRIRDFIDPERIRRTYDQHAAVVRSLQSGDARLAQAQLRAHIWESRSFVRASAQRAIAAAAEAGAR
ncbi:MAG: GntR family transcriptional regulator [Dehalococcoidia bacterium]